MVGPPFPTVVRRALLGCFIVLIRIVLVLKLEPYLLSVLWWHTHMDMVWYFWVYYCNSFSQLESGEVASNKHYSQVSGEDMGTPLLA